MTRLAPILAGLALLVVGGALAARSPHAEKLKLTPAGNRLAKRALLTQADLGPDWTRLPTMPPDDSLTCPRFDPDLSAYTVNGRGSASFAQVGFAQIVSTAEVYASRSQAVADFSKGAKPELAPCLGYALEQGFHKANTGIRASVLSSKMRKAPRLGERSASYRVVTRVRQTGVTLTLVTDFLVFQRGRTIVALGFTGVGSPIPSQPYYASIVAARMR